jgi:hypothetical protein
LLTVFGLGELPALTGAFVFIMLHAKEIRTTLQFDADLTAEFLDLLLAMADLHFGAVALAFIPAKSVA